MEYRKSWKNISALALAAVLALGGVAWPNGGGAFLGWASAQSVSDLQEQYNQLEKKQKTLQDQLKQTENDLEKEEEYQNQLDQQIDLTQSQIELLDAQIQETARELKEKEAAIQDKEIEIEDTYTQLEQRLRAMYLSSDPSMLAMLLESNGLTEFFNRLETIRRVSKHDQKLISSLKQQKEELSQEKAEAEKTKEDLEASQSALQTKSLQLNEAYEKSKNAMQSLEQLQHQYEANKAKIDADMAETEREIQQAIGSAGGGADSPYVGGEFIWPVPGYYNITSGYGYRWGSLHKGIDISSGGIYGKNIVASNSGRVIKVVTNDIPGYSYGKYVMIDHGGGKVTLYGHCSAILVSVGQTVTQGQPIARVGNTGQSTGPHCHFEVRINGVAQNPLNYLNRK